MALALLLALYVISLYHYLLFHTLAELFSIVVAGSIFVVAYTARDLHHNSLVLFLGTAFAACGFLDLIHTVTYAGMNVLPITGTNVPTQLWVAARTLQAGSLLVAPALMRRRIDTTRLALLYLAIVAGLLMAVFSGLFPDAFVTGQGLTPFKRVSEYFISTMFVASAAILRRQRQRLDADLVRWLTIAAGFSVAAELAFTLYVDVYGLANLVGHYFKIAAFYAIYRAVVDLSVRRPHSVLFRRLKESEESFASIVQQSDVGTMVVDEAGRVRFANPAVRGLIDASSIAATLASGHATTPADATRDVAIRRPGGEVGIGEMAVTPTLWEGEPASVVVIRDATQRRKAERALRESEERYRSLYAAMSEGVVLHRLIVDGEGRPTDYVIEAVNPAYEAIVGHPRAEIEGRRASEIGPVLPLLDLFARVIESGQPQSFTTDEEVAGKTLRVSAFSMGDDRVAAVFEDITELRRLEEQYLQAQKMETVGRLAGGVAHDFNNLLTVILGMTQLAIEDLPAESDVRRRLEQVVDASQRASALTRQLLAFSRRQLLQPKVVNLNELVTEMSAILERLLGEDIELSTHLAPDLGAVRVDAGQVEQVLANLAVNARDAMPDGGRLALETMNTVLDEDYAAEHYEVLPGDYVMISVRDTGVGMTEEVQQHLFEPFFTTKERGKGTGLGLATAHGIVRQHGGHIGVHSEPGRGTTFRVYFPRVTSPIESLDHEPHETYLPGGTETVLIVEDEADVRAFVSETLRHLGYTVLEAGDGAEALRLCREGGSKLDLLIADVVLPSLNGKLVAERLQKHCPRLPVIYISGYTEDVIVHHGVLEEGVILIPKPFTAETLAQRVRAALDLAA